MNKLENNPYKTEFYNERCPIFGDIQRLESLEIESKYFQECLLIIRECRTNFIVCFHLEDNVPCLGNSLWPSSKVIESLIGFPAKFLEDLRAIYKRGADSIYTDSLNASAALFKRYRNNYSGMKGECGIPEEVIWREALCTNGVSPGAREKIDSEALFNLFAIEMAIFSVKSFLVEGMRFEEDSSSMKYLEDARTYSKRAATINRAKMDAFLIHRFMSESDELRPAAEKKYLESKKKSIAKIKQKEKEREIRINPRDQILFKIIEYFLANEAITNNKGEIKLKERSKPYKIKSNSGFAIDLYAFLQKIKRNPFLLKSITRDTVHIEKFNLYLSENTLRLIYIPLYLKRV
ncbi:MAG: hypothetical protein ABIK92_13090 [Pseudomonadota bacterium]